MKMAENSLVEELNLLTRALRSEPLPDWSQSDSELSPYAALIDAAYAVISDLEEFRNKSELLSNDGLWH